MTMTRIMMRKTISHKKANRASSQAMTEDNTVDYTLHFGIIILLLPKGTITSRSLQTKCRHLYALYVGRFFAVRVVAVILKMPILFYC